MLQSRIFNVANMDYNANRDGGPTLMLAGSREQNDKGAHACADRSTPCFQLQKSDYNAH